MVEQNKYYKSKYKYSMDKYTSPQEQAEEEVQLVPLMKMCLEEFKTHWWWFLLSAMLCVSCGWYYQQKQQRIYQRQAVMLIEDSDASSAGGGATSSRSSKRNAMNTLLELNGVSVGDNLKNEIFILSSKRLMLRVVEKLHLDIDYTIKAGLHTKSLYGDKELPFEVIFQSKCKGKALQTFKVAKKDASTVTLKGLHDKEGNELPDLDAQLGQMVQTPYGQICVVRGKQFGAWTDEEINVSRMSIKNAATRFISELAVSEYDKETSLIVLNCSDNNVERADHILACLYDTYKEDVVDNKNRVAQNTARFIDERIQIIGRELSSVENQLASFKKRNKLVDFTQSSQIVLNATNDARQQSLQLETQLNVARYLSDYLHSHSNNHDLIPALNVADASFNTQIGKYNDVMNQRNQMVANSSDKQTIVAELDRQLAQMRQTIASSLKSYVNSIELRLRDAQANESALTGQVSGAPDQEKRGLIIGRELSSVENQLASFKKRNKLVDFTQSSQIVLNATNDARQQSLQLETQLNVARYLSDYLHSHSNNHDLIPALNVADASFNTQIGKYNDVMNQRNQMVANSSDKQTIVAELDRQLAQMRQTIASSLKSYVNSIELRLRDAQANESALTGQVSGAPDQEKRGLDIQRQQSLKEALYTYLLNKREEVALQQAINEANVRLVEGPIGGEAPIKPKSAMIMLVSLIIGLAIPTAILWVKHLLDVTVHSRKDIEDATTIPVLGEVPLVKEVAGNNTLISNLASDSPMVEAFRILRFGLGYMRQNPKVLVATSTTPGQGKSFITRNMGIILAMAGKKVVVIDADIRKRTLSGAFHHTIGLTAYLSDDYTKVEDIIKKDGIAKGVDFIPAGHMPPNPSELLMSERLDELVKHLRSEYDYILFDTTPMLSVADANIVNRVSDTTIFVIRVGVQERAFLPELERMYQDNRFKSLSIVLNGVDPEHGYHGYGYGYGYGYAYDKRNKGRNVKGLINRIRRK